MTNIVFRDIEHEIRFKRMIAFQEFVHTHTPYENFHEFIRLSRLNFNSEIDDSMEFFDYNRLTFITQNENFLVQSSLEPGMLLHHVFVMIPCIVEPRHGGVVCSVHNHLLGVGCADCLHEFGITGMYPIE